MTAVYTFEDIKTDLLNCCYDIAAIAKRNNWQQPARTVESVTKKLKLATFNLVVLGEFKRGKSTLINAILGTDLLPTGVIPLTSVATVIYFSPSPTLRIVYLNGTEQTAPLMDLKEYVTERQNPKNSKQVQLVEIGCASNLLKSGLRIVDTPGIGSVHEHNTQSTYDYLPECDAILFVFSADQPASKAEIEFLKESSTHAVRKFYVLNKTDNLTVSELAESLQFLKDTLKIDRNEPNEIVVFPLSARQAVIAQNTDDCTMLAASNFPKLRDCLEEFIAVEKVNVVVDSANAHLQLALAQMHDLALLQNEASKMPLNTLEQAIDKFRKATQDILREQRDASFVVRGECNQLVQQIDERLKPFIDDVRPLIVKQTSTFFDEHRSEDKTTLIHALRQQLQESIQHAIDKWKHQEEGNVEQTFTDINLRFVAKADYIVERIKQTIAESFGIQISTSFAVEPLTTRSRYYYHVDHPFSLMIEAAPLLLPDFMAKQIIKNRFVEFADDEFSRHAGKLRADFQERIESSALAFLRRFEKETTDSIAEIEKTLSKAVAEKTKTEATSHAEVSYMLQTIELIESIRQQLKAINTSTESPT